MKKIIVTAIGIAGVATVKAQHVGIGTTTPAAQLDVHGTVNLVSRFNTTTNAMYIALAENSVNRGYIGSYSGAAEDVDFGTTTNNTTGNIHFTTLASPRMTIDPAGNVGIGTTTPAYRLDVNGRLRLKHSSNTAGIYFDGTTLPTRSFIGTFDDDHVGLYGSGGAGWNLLMNVNNGHVGIGTTAPQFPLDFANQTGGKISFWSEAGSNYGIGLQPGLLQIHTAASIDDVAFGYGSSAAFTETMRVKGNGRVGIGTSTPAAALDVHASAGNLVSNYNSSSAAMYNTYSESGTVRGYIGSYTGAAEDFDLGTTTNNTTGKLHFTTQASPKMTIDNTGNVGIGTTTPQARLSFSNAAGNKISFANNAGGHYGIGLQNNLLQFFSENNACDLAFGYGSSEAFTENMRVKGNGNVGIGTNNPVYKLDVAGRLRLKHGTGTAGIYFDGVTQNTRSFIGTYNDDYFGMYTSGNNSWNFLMNVNTGNIGIGHTAPQFPLSFGNIGGGKISFWDDVNGNYGIGLQNNLLQMHTNGSFADIAFGYGSSAAFTETMRIKGNGKVGIGTNNPTATLEVDGYTMLGSDAPAIKTKFLTRTITSVNGSGQSINHGLHPDRILSLTVQVTFTSTEGYPSFVGPNNTASGLEFSYTNVYGAIQVFPKPGNSASLLNQTMKVFIVYKDL